MTTPSAATLGAPGEDLDDVLPLAVAGKLSRRWTDTVGLAA